MIRDGDLNPRGRETVVVIVCLRITKHLLCVHSHLRNMTRWSLTMHISPNRRKQRLPTDVYDLLQRPDRCETHVRPAETQTMMRIRCWKFETVALSSLRRATTGDDARVQRVRRDPVSDRNDTERPPRRSGRREKSEEEKKNRPRAVRDLVLSSARPRRKEPIRYGHTRGVNRPSPLSAHVVVFSRTDPSETAAGLRGGGEGGSRPPPHGPRLDFFSKRFSLTFMF